MSYVVSEQFYNNELPLEDKFEAILYKYINKDSINVNELIDLAKESLTWNTKEQFYRIPIIINMLKTYKSNMVTGV